MNKIRHAMLRAALPLVGSLALVSCQGLEEGNLLPQSNAPLTFSVTGLGGAEEAAQTRSSSRPALPPATVIEAVSQPSGDQPLYLHAIVSDGITSPVNQAIAEAEQALTKGVPVDGIDSFHETIGLFGYSYSGTWKGTETPDFMYDIEASRQGTASPAAWVTDPQFFLPGDGRNVRFFAYAPRTMGFDDNPDQEMMGGANFQRPERTSQGAPAFKIIARPYSRNQADICFASGADPLADGTVSLNFKHALTAVKFTAASSLAGCTIKQIYMFRVKSSGTFTLNADGSDGVWTDLGGANDFSLYDAYPLQLVVPVDAKNDTPIDKDGKGTFFMIPQAFESATDAYVYVEFLRPGEAGVTTATFSLAGQTWQQGTTVTYRLSMSDFIIQIENGNDISNGVMTVPFAGGTKTFQVTSKRGSTPVDYKLQFSMDGGKTWVENQSGVRPRRITSTSISGASQVRSNTISFSRGQSYVDGDEAKALRSADWRDEGLITGGSANCYIVSAAGRYRFLAVYGNSLLSGSRRNENVLNRGYVDGAGSAITSPYLPDGIKAEVVWQDVPGLVRISEGSGIINGISGSGNDKRIEIVVGGSEQEKSIAPGNALIAAVKGGVILWTWHIWVTTNPGSGTVGGKTFMKRPLGFVSGGNIVSEPASTILMRAVAADGNYSGQASAPVTINLQAGSNLGSTSPRMPAYQWGRMTPMYPSTAQGDQSVLYDQEGKVLSQQAPVAMTYIKERIYQPMKYNNKNSENYSYLWNAHRGVGQWENGELYANVTKSIYDPCPDGYHVPNYDAFVSGWYSNPPNPNLATMINQLTSRPDVSASVFGMNVSGVVFPVGGARLKSQYFLPSSLIGNFYYGGVWTAARKNAENTAYGSDTKYVLAFFSIQSSFAPTAAAFFVPQLGRYFYNSAQVANADPLNAYPILPQRGN